MTRPSPFEHLRELLHRPPTADAWARLVLCLSTWPTSTDRGMAFQYVYDHLLAQPGVLEIAWRRAATTALPAAWLSSLRRAGRAPGPPVSLPPQSGLQRHHARAYDEQGELLVMEAAGLESDARVDAVLVAPGTFIMGSPPHEPERKSIELQHEVTITHHLLVRSTPVHNGLYIDLMGYNPRGTSGSRGGDRRVAHRVNWFEAVTACNALSERDGLDPAYVLQNRVGLPGQPPRGRAGQYRCDVRWNRRRSGWRLPTEAEWEYVAELGSRRPWYGTIKEIGWCRGIGEQARLAYLAEAIEAEVGTRRPNAWGLYDVHGLAHEWCWDWFHPDTYATRLSPAINPVGPQTGTRKVGRGGSYASPPANSRVASRGSLDPWKLVPYCGFRPVRALLGEGGEGEEDELTTFYNDASEPQEEA